MTPAGLPDTISNVQPRLRLSGITKAYPSVVANEDINLAVLPGEIHAVLGENGAGKSTLMKIIYGVVQADAGTIQWEGREAVIASPADARRLGIGMVFQHFALFETLRSAKTSRWRSRLVARAPTFPAASASFRQIRAAARPTPAHSHDVRRRAPAGRDRPLPAAGPAPDHHGRADVGADAASCREAVRDACAAWPPKAAASSTSATSWMKSARSATRRRCCARVGSPASAIRARNRRRRSRA